MNYVTDDFTRSYGQSIALKKALPPDMNNIIDDAISDAYESGVDISDEKVMAGFIADTLSNIKKAAKKVTGGKNFQIVTDDGITSVGPEGVSYTENQPKEKSLLVQKTSSDVIFDYLKNPYVVAGLISIPVLIMIMKKRNRRR